MVTKGWSRSSLLWGSLLVVGVLLTYSHSWQAGFIWDDDQHITQNPCIIGPLGLKEIWTTHAARICPLVITTFWLEHLFWGLNPLPYHLFNIGMHAACAIVLWRLLRSLEVPGAWFGATLWALHPVQVETVAWITELKNTQSCFFYLLAIVAFVRYNRMPAEKKTYALAFLFAALAMASKSSTVVLPLVLGLVMWWIDGRFPWRKLPRLAPFFVLSFLTGLWSMWSQRLEGAKDPHFALLVPERLAIAGKALWFYLGKLLWPHPLIFIYPRWQLDLTNLLTYLPAVSFAVALLFLYFRTKERLNPLFFTLAYFAIALLPVLGLVDHYFLRYSFVGDHFQYLASIGPLAFLAAASSVALRRWKGRYFLGVIVLVCLALLSWRQSEIYKDVETLWGATISRNPRAWIAYNNLGNLRLNNGELDAAADQFEKALQVRPDLAIVHYNLGNVLFREGELEKAISHYETALSLEETPHAHINLGNTLFLQGQLERAVSNYQRALQLDQSAEVQTNLGNVLALEGRTGEAVEHFEEALKIEPTYAEAHFNLAVALEKQGQFQVSVSHYERALGVRPSYAEAANNLAWILATCQDASVRDGERAVTLAESASKLETGENPAVLDTLAAAYAEAGRFQEAIKTAQRALLKAELGDDHALALDLKRKLDLYQANTAFHSSAN